MDTPVTATGPVATEPEGSEAVGDGAVEPVEPAGSSTSARWALITFLAMVAVTAVVVPAKLGNQRWFTNDEWDFLATRHLTDVGDLFRPHNEHWTTLPAVAYRLVWSVVGLHSYWPYQLLSVAAHIALVVLLRVVMRRAGVGPWIATAAAGSLLLFGPGDQNIVWAFQVTFVAALALGLVQLILADHDGGLDRRDWLGLFAGTAALMCSGVGITMVAVVGLATLVRRGWRMAAFHTVPLAALYGTWWAIERPPTARNPYRYGLGHIVGEMAAFVAQGITAAFGGLGHFPVVGAALAVLLVVGLVLAWKPIGWSGFRRVGAPIAALLVGLLLFFVVSAYGRWWAGSSYAAVSRYVYTGAAMLLPALAVAADAVIRRWRVAAPVVLVVLLVGVPFNVKAFVDEKRYVGPAFDESEQLVMAVAASPYADQAPEWVEFDPRVNPELTIGWLRDRRDAGDLPAAEPVDEATANQIPIRLGVVQRLGPVTGRECTTLSGKLDLRPGKGTDFGFSGGVVAVAPLDDAGQPTAPPLKFEANHGTRLMVLLDGLHIQVKPGTQGQPITFCQ